MTKERETRMGLASAIEAKAAAGSPPNLPSASTGKGLRFYSTYVLSPRTLRGSDLLNDKVREM